MVLYRVNKLYKQLYAYYFIEIQPIIIHPPPRFNFCNWGEIRASSLSVPKKWARWMGIFLKTTRRLSHLSYLHAERTRVAREHNGRELFSIGQEEDPVCCACVWRGWEAHMRTTNGNSYQEDEKKIPFIALGNGNYSCRLCLSPFPFTPPPPFNFNRRKTNDFTPAGLDFQQDKTFRIRICLSVCKNRTVFVSGTQIRLTLLLYIL